MLDFNQINFNKNQPEPLGFAREVKLKTSVVSKNGLTTRRYPVMEFRIVNTI